MATQHRLRIARRGAKMDRRVGGREGASGLAVVIGALEIQTSSLDGTYGPQWTMANAHLRRRCLARSASRARLVTEPVRYTRGDLQMHPFPNGPPPTSSEKHRSVHLPKGVYLPPLSPPLSSASYPFEPIAPVQLHPLLPAPFPSPPVVYLHKRVQLHPQRLWAPSTKRIESISSRWRRRWRRFRALPTLPNAPRRDPCAKARTWKRQKVSWRPPKRDASRERGPTARRRKTRTTWPWRNRRLSRRTNAFRP